MIDISKRVNEIRELLPMNDDLISDILDVIASINKIHKAKTFKLSSSGPVLHLSTCTYKDKNCPIKLILLPTSSSSLNYSDSHSSQVKELIHYIEGPNFSSLPNICSYLPVSLYRDIIGAPKNEFCI